MFSFLSQYLSCYYNYYFNKNFLEKNENKNHSINTPSLEINNSYDLLYSTTSESPHNLELIFYKIYSNKNTSECESQNSTIFKHDNKMFKLNSKENYKNYISVIHTVSNYKLKNIILPEQIYNNKYSRHEYIEIFPYYPDGDLFNYIYTQTLSLSQKKNIFKQLVNIILPFHKVGLVHRDIKMENFLIQFDKNNDEILIKLTDLDFGCIGTKDLTFTGGTMHYASYELINFKQITSWYSSDIWSLNVILYILLFNRFPWNNTIEYETYNSKLTTVEPCDIFNKYLISEPSDYWNERLRDLFDKDDIHFSVYSKILSYGFNVKWNERTDISYIHDLLTLI